MILILGAPGLALIELEQKIPWLLWTMIYAGTGIPYCLLDVDQLLGSRWGKIIPDMKLFRCPGWGLPKLSGGIRPLPRHGTSRKTDQLNHPVWQATSWSDPQDNGDIYLHVPLGCLLVCKALWWRNSLDLWVMLKLLKMPVHCVVLAHCVSLLGLP